MDETTEPDPPEPYILDRIVIVSTLRQARFSRPLLFPQLYLDSQLFSIYWEAGSSSAYPHPIGSPAGCPDCPMNSFHSGVKTSNRAKTDGRLGCHSTRDEADPLDEWYRCHRETRRRDPRDLNETISPHYPIPTFDDIGTQVHGYKVFTKLDCTCAY